jgi:hypothetical protein
MKPRGRETYSAGVVAFKPQGGERECLAIRAVLGMQSAKADFVVL